MSESDRSMEGFYGVGEEGGYAADEGTTVRPKVVGRSASTPRRRERARDARENRLSALFRDLNRMVPDSGRRGEEYISSARSSTEMEIIVPAARGGARRAGPRARSTSAGGRGGRAPAQKAAPGAPTFRSSSPDDASVSGNSEDESAIPPAGMRRANVVDPRITTIVRRSNVNLGRGWTSPTAGPSTVSVSATTSVGAGGPERGPERGDRGRTGTTGRQSRPTTVEFDGPRSVKFDRGRTTLTDVHQVVCILIVSTSPPTSTHSTQLIADMHTA